MNARRLRRLIATALAGAGMLMAGGAFAGATTYTTLTLILVEQCSFVSTSYSITIGNASGKINPSLATAATGSVNVKYKCSKGTSPTFTVPGSVALVSGSKSMTATITSTNQGAGSGYGYPKNLTVSGSIAAAQFRDLPAGVYTGSVSISITP